MYLLHLLNRPPAAVSQSPSPHQLRGMHSHHSHSGAFCAHADPDCSPSSMLQRAYDRGFTSYCLSEHVPRGRESQLYPEEVQAGLTPAQLERRFDQYLTEARRCAQLYSTSGDDERDSRTMQVLVGAELESIDAECRDYLERLLDNNRNKAEGSASDSKNGQNTRQPGSIGKGKVDYLVGSLHHVNSIPIDFDQPTFELALDAFSEGQDEVEGGPDIPLKGTRRHLRLISAYLDQQKELIEHFHPEVIGHFDLCRLYGPTTPMTLTTKAALVKDKTPPLDPIIVTACADLLKEVEEKVRRNVSIVVKYGGLFEINSSSLRKGWPTAYPGEDVLDVILSLDGRICLSDDAHSHEQVGLHYDRVREYLTGKGVESIWMLQKGPSVELGLEAFPRGTSAVKVDGWASHPFWSPQKSL